MAAMANNVEVFKGSYETSSTAWTEYELYTWVVWVGEEPHKINVRRHYRTTVEYDGSKVSKTWQANGATFCVKSKTWGSFDLYVNGTKFMYLPETTTQRAPAAPAADIIICGNCGVAGHYARGFARPSNRNASRSGAQRDNEDGVGVEFSAEVEFSATGEEQTTSDATYGDDGFISGFLSSF